MSLISSEWSWFHLYTHYIYENFIPKLDKLNYSIYYNSDDIITSDSRYFLSILDTDNEYYTKLHKGSVKKGRIGYLITNIIDTEDYEDYLEYAFSGTLEELERVCPNLVEYVKNDVINNGKPLKKIIEYIDEDIKQIINDNNFLKKVTNLLNIYNDMDNAHQKYKDIKRLSKELVYVVFIHIDSIYDHYHDELYYILSQYKEEEMSDDLWSKLESYRADTEEGEVIIGEGVGEGEGEGEEAIVEKETPEQIIQDLINRVPVYDSSKHDYKNFADYVTDDKSDNIFREYFETNIPGDNAEFGQYVYHNMADVKKDIVDGVLRINNVLESGAILKTKIGKLFGDAFKTKYITQNGGSIEKYQQFIGNIKMTFRRVPDYDDIAEDGLGNYKYETKSYNLDKKNKTPPILSKNIQNHLNIICYEIIKKILNDTIPNSIHEHIRQTYQDLNSNQEFLKTQEYILVARIANNLLIDLIKSYIYQGVATSIINHIKQIKIPTKLNIKKPDTGFKLDLNASLTNITSIINSFDPNNNSHILLGIELANPSNIHDNQTRLTSYDFFTDNILDNQNISCVNINLDILNLFDNTRVNLNIQDHDGKSPIYYAIFNINPELVEHLINHNASIYIKDNRNYTPVSYTKNLLLNMLSYTQNMYDFLTKNYITNITSYITNKKEYKNNIPKNINIIFKQIIYMINHYFYYIMSNYPKKWKVTSKEELYEYLISSKILNKIHAVDLTSIFDDELISSMNIQDSNLAQLYELNESVERIIDLDGQKISMSDIKKMKKKLREELSLLRTKKSKDPKEIEIIKKNKQKVYKNIKHIDNAIKKSPVKNKIKTPEKIIDVDKQKIKTNLTSSSLNLSDNPIELYDNLFDTYFNYTNPILQYDYYQIFFKKYLTNPKLSKNILNMPYLVSILLEKLLKQKQSQDKKYLQKLSAITRFYLYIINPIIQDFNDLSQTDLDSNYVLNIIISFIKHIIKYNIFSNLYLTILRTVSTYLNIHYQNTDHQDIKNIKKSINKIIQDPDLKNYILTTLPDKFIKITLKLKSDSQDKTLEEDPKTLLDNINNKLKILEPNLFNPDNTLMNNLRDYIYPYYIDIINQIIKNLFILSKNYLKLLKTTGDLTYILLILLDSTKYDS